MSEKQPTQLGETYQTVPYKFERLEVWKLALQYNDLIYAMAESLPRNEEYNLKSQIVRASTSIALNIAEGSTGQTDAEQNRFLGMALRSQVETVACLRLIERRGYLTDPALMREIDLTGGKLFAKLQSFRNAITPRSMKELAENYQTEEVSDDF